MRALVAGVVVVLVVAVGAPASAAPRFANCDAMHAGGYPAGIAKTAAAANRAVADGMARPAVSAKLYAAHKGSDRDRDGVACEAS